MKNIFLFFIFIFSLNLFAQENLNWYFGKNCGIKFNSVPPQNDPQSQINQWEGSASISDKNGNLLFYTDGITVWNKAHQVMTNGTGLNGHYSSLVSAYIVKQPGQEDIYYLFTIDAAERNMYGICYSIVDMSSGLGSVVQKNVSLFRYAAPRIAAVHHANGRDIWIVSTKQMSNQIYSFLLTDEGMNLAPVVATLTDDVFLDKGFMKFDCIGERLYIANTTQNEIVIVKYDRLTADADLKHKLYKNDGVRRWYYSLEISSDRKKLFATTFNPTSIIRFDLASDNEDEIINSMHYVGSKSQAFFWGGIQITPSNSIYIANYDQHNLSVISNPNAEISQLEFFEDGFDLGDGIAQHGLPAFFKRSCGAPLQLEIIADTKILCEGESFEIISNGITSGDFTWTGPNGFTSNQRDISFDNATSNMTGVYKLRVNSGGYSYQAEEYILVQPAPKFNKVGNTSFCMGDSSTISLQPINFVSGVIFNWSDGQKGFNVKFKEEGVYYVTAISSNGCTTLDSVVITEIPPLDVNIIGDLKHCQGETTNLSSNLSGNNYLLKWSTGETSNNIKVTKSGIYHLEVQEIDGCKGWDTIEVVFNPSPNTEINGGAYRQICYGSEIILEPVNKSENTVYYWLDGYSTQIRSVNNSGKYILVGKNDAGCITYDTVTVEIIEKPEIDIFPADTVFLCQGEQTTLEVRNVPQGASIFWSNGQKSRKINVSNEGLYSVIAELSEGCADTAFVYVKVDENLSVAISGDTEICSGDTAMLRTNYNGSNYIYKWSTGETTSSILVTNSGNYKVTVVSPSGCTGEGEINVFSYQSPSAKLNIEGKIDYCEGEEIILKPISYDENFNYFWNDGSTELERIITETGVYTLYAENNGHCLDSSTAEIIIYPNPEAKILSPDGLSLCNQTEIRLIAANYNPEYTYSWSNGIFGEEIIFTETGIVYLTVTNDHGCSDRDSVVIVKSGEYELKIISSKEFLCANDSLTLGLTEKFEQYLWSTGETTAQITIRDAGLYTVQVTDDYGCSGVAEIDIVKKQIDFILNNPDATNFGELCYSDNLTHEFQLIASGYAINLQDAFSSGKSFNIDKFKSGKYQPGEIIPISITFDPQQIGMINETLTLEISEPCYQFVEFNLTGEAFSFSEVSLPNVELKVNKKYCLPIEIKGICEIPTGVSSDFTAAITFDMKYFMPDSSVNAVINENKIENDMRILEISGNTAFQNDKLCEICGLSLLGDNKTVPIKFTEFTWDNDFIRNESIDGSIDITDICREDFFVINFYEESEFNISPNPADDFINVKIKTEEPGIVGIYITDLQGRTVIKEEFQNEGKNIYDRRIDLSGLSSGAYLLQARTLLSTTTQRITIIK